MDSRREFFKRTAGFLAMAAVAKLPVLPEPPAAPMIHPEPRAVHTFNVFGRTTTYAVPGSNRP